MDQNRGDPIVLQDNFRLFHQQKISNSCIFSPTTETVVTKFGFYEHEMRLKLAQDTLQKYDIDYSMNHKSSEYLCLMTHIQQTVDKPDYVNDSNADSDISEVCLMASPLHSLIDFNPAVDLELACLSQMTITVIFIPNF
jgi:hypothetical protein